MELRKAWACGNAEDYPCAFPVHVDGTCNGLQHYAALGRDHGGGAAVNLMPSDKPQVVVTFSMFQWCRRQGSPAVEFSLSWWDF